MTPKEAVAEIRSRLKQTAEDLLAAKKKWQQVEGEFQAFLEEHPPLTLRIQEAYRNPDGTYSAPHWDELYHFQNQMAVDPEELRRHILCEGEWEEIFRNPKDDPRPGCRRVIDVTWGPL